MTNNQKNWHEMSAMEQIQSDPARRCIDSVAYRFINSFYKQGWIRNKNGDGWVNHKTGETTPPIDPTTLAKLYQEDNLSDIGWKFIAQELAERLANCGKKAGEIIQTLPQALAPSADIQKKTIPLGLADDIFNEAFGLSG